MKGVVYNMIISYKKMLSLPKSVDKDSFGEKGKVIRNLIVEDVGKVNESESIVKFYDFNNEEERIFFIFRNLHLFTEDEKFRSGEGVLLLRFKTFIDAYDKIVIPISLQNDSKNWNFYFTEDGKRLL